MIKHEALKAIDESLFEEEIRNERIIHKVRIGVHGTSLLMISIARLIIGSSMHLRFITMFSFMLSLIVIDLVFLKYLRKGRYFASLKYFLTTMDLLYIAIGIASVRFTMKIPLFTLTSDIPAFLLLFLVNTLSGIRFNFKISIFYAIASLLILAGCMIYDLQNKSAPLPPLILITIFKGIMLVGIALISGYIGKRAKELIVKNYLALEEKSFIRKIFGRYVSGAVANKILAGDIELGGEERKLTILFSDIRNFTSICEKTEPQSVVKIINRYFNIMVNIIFKQDGIVAKFTGDGFMAIFGAPIAHENDEERAILAALEMREQLEKFNEDQKRRKAFEISFGIGISTGTAIVGNIGSEERMEYTALGDTVNTASRIEQLCKKLNTDVLIDENTYFPVKQVFLTKKMEVTKIKGKKELVQVYKVIRKCT
jgi:class 3 adenylate cyclase